MKHIISTLSRAEIKEVGLSRMTSTIAADSQPKLQSQLLASQSQAFNLQSSSSISPETVQNHGEKKLYKCESCSKPFASSKAMRIHQEQWCVKHQTKCKQKPKNFKVKSFRLSSGQSCPVPITNSATDSNLQQQQPSSSAIRRSTRTSKKRFQNEENKSASDDDDNNSNSNSQIKNQNKCKIKTGKKIRTLTSSRYNCRFCTNSFSIIEERCIHEGQFHLTKVKPYECKICQRRFYFASDCNFHERLHGRDNENSSNFASSILSENVLQQKSKRQPNPEGESGSTSKTNFECKFCASAFADMKRLKLHVKWRHGDKTGKVGNKFQKMKTTAFELEPQASELFKTAKITQEVEVIDLNSGSGSCSNSSIIQSTLKQPILINSESKTSPNFENFTCKVCNQRFKTEMSKVEHEKNHNGCLPFPFKCFVCEKRFPTRGKLNRHGNYTNCAKGIKVSWPKSKPVSMRDVKDKDKLIQQNINEFDIKTNEGGALDLTSRNVGLNLSVHAENLANASSDNVPFENTVQGQIEGQSQNLGPEKILNIKEKLLHLNTKLEYACNICGRRQNSYAAAARHSRLHTVDRPKLTFKCQYCGKILSRKDTLKCHEAIHTGVKKYVCHICQEAFRWPTSCSKHMKKHHQNMQESNI